MKWTIEFGYLPVAVDCKESRFCIETASEFNDSIEHVRSSGQVDDEWYWPPLGIGHPPRPVPVFSLPTTHRIHIYDREYQDANRLAEFLVTVLGFLYAILLMPGPWVSFYRVSIDPRRWHDFVLGGGARERILSRAADMWTRYPELHDRMFGAIRWHTFGLSYEHPFEQFSAQYTVLDACWKLHTLMKQLPERSVGHSKRIEALAAAYSLDVPAHWQRQDSPLAVVEIRNALLHEGRWGNSPLGFNHPAPPFDAIHLELFWFNTRLILALLGEDTPYVRSPINRETHLLA